MIYKTVWNPKRANLELVNSGAELAKQFAKLGRLRFNASHKVYCIHFAITVKRPQGHYGAINNATSWMLH